ncbi:permease-like cell division protein FtsX [Dactylosporangium sp. CS-033363]|uniref:permease-like cell division protein FtsX n=1 Tax=Dactylosporangium sp. CS-033363 TaxID=3239935 RepID=UPI003D8AC93B
MPEFDEHLDDRLRAALGELGDGAQSALRPPGAAGIPAAARRRRLAGLSAGTATLLAAVGAIWLIGGPVTGLGPAAPACLPAQGRTFLPDGATDVQKEQLRAAIAGSPYITSYTYVSETEAWERFRVMYSDAPELVEATDPMSIPAGWDFTLRCAGDFPALEEHLLPYSRGVWCSCVPIDKPVEPAGTPSSWEPQPTN